VGHESTKGQNASKWKLANQGIRSGGHWVQALRYFQACVIPQNHLPSSTEVGVRVRREASENLEFSSRFMKPLPT
jgi:hypothetical protein